MRAALAVALAAGMMGAARYKTGLLLLDAVVRSNRGAPPQEQFRRGWSFVQRTRWLFAGREFIGNRYQSDWKNYALLKLLALLDRQGTRYEPVRRIIGEAGLARLTQGQGPVILVTIHTHTSTALNRLFEEYGVAASVVAISQAPQRTSELLGLKGKIDFIALDENCLLAARKKLRLGRTVCCNIDFTVREKGSLFHDLYISEAFFELARSTKAKLVYALVNASSDGEVEIVLNLPANEGRAASPRELAADFVKFLQRHSAPGLSWKIGPWSLRSRSGRKQYDNLCLRRIGQVH